MVGKKLYEERVLELIRQNVIRSARSVSTSIRQHYYALAADAILQRKFEKEPPNAQLDFGDMIQEVMEQHEKDIENLAWRGEMVKPFHESLEEYTNRVHEQSK